jgi:ribonuclease HI
MKYTVYSDGSSIGNPGPAGWAAYIVETKQELSGNLRVATNNEAEMTAVMYGIADIPDGSDVCVVTDSKLVIGWLCQRWKAKTNPKIGELRFAIFELVKNKHLSATFRKTEGHSTDQYNNLVDRLAYQASCKAKDVSTPKDVGRLRLVLDIDGLNMDSAEFILGAIEKAGGIAQGSIEEINASLETVKSKRVDNNKLS